MHNLLTQTQKASLDETRIFACGEYTHACRLRASSTRSARRMRTPRLWRCGSESSIPPPKKRKADHQVMVGIGVFVQCTKIFRFATGEQAPRRLSLKCEPRALRQSRKHCGENPLFCCQEKKNRPSSDGLAAYIGICCSG